MPPPVVILSIEAKKFAETANDGNIDLALELVRKAAFNMQQTLHACGEIRSDFRSQLLAKSAPASDGRLQFALKTAEQLEIPSGTFSGVSRSNPDDYLEARMFILMQLDKQRPRTRTVRRFYPEYVGDRRSRLCAIATDHAGLGPGDLKQIVFFSLGGSYTWADAEASTRRYTTCGVFLRACFSGVGYSPRGGFPLSPGTIYGYLTGSGHKPPGIDVNARDVLRLSKGDIFHIRGEGNTDHVGLILRVIDFDIDANRPLSMATVEGGQDPGGIRTEFYKIKQIRYVGGMYYLGDKDWRPLRAIINVDNYTDWP